jgi:hypothetical protein
MDPESVHRIYRDLLQLGAPVLIFAAASTLLAFVLLRAVGTQVSREYVLFPLAFAILGGTCGAIAGSSFEPLVGAVVTGILGLVSAMVSYGFTRTGDRVLRASIPVIVILLLINALAGLSVGRTWKIKWDSYATNLDRYRAKRDGIWIPVTREYQMVVLRKCLQESKSTQDARARCGYETLFPDQ